MTTRWPLDAIPVMSAIVQVQVSPRNPVADASPLRQLAEDDCRFIERKVRLELKTRV